MMKFVTPGAWCRLQCALVLSVVLSPALADDFSITSGLSAHWYNPERSGEGLVLEILSEEAALLYWFTYDDDGNQRWLIDVGDIVGDEIIFPEMTVTRGGRFGPSFDPDEVEYEVVGEAVLQFSDCDHAEFSYSAFGHSETIAMQRLSQTMAAGCQPINGVPGQPIRAYAGQSGSWYDPAHTGEGYTLQWMSRDEAVLIWFSYDTEGNQYWMIGVGSRDVDQLVFPSLQTTTGGRFGSQFDSSQLESTDWGTLVLNLDCDEGSAEYESVLPEFGNGALAMSRLSSIDGLSCPWSPPEFSEIYSVSYEEIPLQSSQETANVRPQDISNQGHVAALEHLYEGMRVWTWHPGDLTLQQLPAVHKTEPVLIRPDGQQIVAHNLASPPSGELPGGLPMIWQDEEWSEWPGRSESNALLRRYSQNGSRVVGTVNVSVEGGPRSRAWRSNKDGIQEILPVSEGIRSARGEAISNDGQVVVGDQISSDGTQAFRHTTIWKTGSDPIIIRDSMGSPLAYPGGCNADCSIVAGTYQGGELDPSHPNFGQAWLWIEGGGVKYLPRIDGAIEGLTLPTYVVQDMTEDGSMIVGRFLRDIKGALGSRVFLWTQATGMVTASELFQAAGVGDDGWFSMGSPSISPNGKFLLVSGARLGSSQNPEGSPRAAVLKLTQK